jgi:PBSX family phage terminase large subunit
MTTETFRVDDPRLVDSAPRTTHVYRPRGSAVECLQRRDDELLMCGPSGTGKSRAALEKMCLAALKYPGMRGLIVRKTAASLGASALKTWRNDVVPELLGNSTVYFYGGSQEEPPQYRFNNGSTIAIGGMDKPSKIMSTEYDLVFGQEATEFTITDWEHITTRLRNGRMPYQQLLTDCNPDTPTHWLKTRCDEGRTRMIDCRHEDNPRLFDLLPDGSFRVTAYGESYLRKLDALTGVRYLRLRKGLWVAAEGVIYEDFSPDVHVLDTMPAGWEHWARYWAVDFGYTNPFVLQCWAEDPDGRLYLYREIYHTKRTVDQHAEKILSIVAPGGRWIEPKPQRIVCDHDSENRRRFEEVSGLGTRNADKRVKAGIEIAQVRYRVAGDGKPRIFFLRDAVVERDPDLEDARKPCSTLEEIPGYVWASSPDGKPVKEEPVKMNDHGCDAKRYICVDRDPGSRPRIRSFSAR